MEAKVSKWGNSLGIRVPSIVAEQLKIHEGATVEIAIKGNEMIIKRKRYDLDELLEQITKENCHSETDWGPPVGKEEWWQMDSHDTYIPDRGDLIWLYFQPTLGHEQSGRRPALVLSPSKYNGLTGLAVVCPVTSRTKGYPFEILLPEDAQVVGVVLADHIRNIDWASRGCTYIGRADNQIFQDVLDRLFALLEPK
jgi:mRNA interferase MazF